MKLPRCEECLFPPHRGNVNNRLRPEKVLSSCFRTGVRFPSAPPCKNAIPFGMAFLHGCAEGREKPSGSTDWISRRVNAAILRFAQNQKENPVGTEAAKPPEYSPRLHPATERLPSQGPIPPIRGKCPEGTKGVGMLSAQLTERLSPNSENLRRCAPLGSPERGAVSAQPRLRGCRRFATAGCLRRPYLFRLAGKDREEKGRLDAFSAVCV